MDKKKLRRIMFNTIMFVAAAGLSGCLSGSVSSVTNATNATNTIEEFYTEQEYFESVDSPEIADLEAEFQVILQGISKEDIAGYAVDENFLMWFAANYGEDVVRQLAWNVLDDEMELDDWYEITGESMHVLWLRYCDNTGFQSYQTENVLWMECAGPNETVISFTGDFNFAEDWYTMEAYKQNAKGLEGCITPDLIEILRDSDVLFMNNEFVYSDCTDALSGKAYTFRADLERVSLLHELGADIVSLGNNHTYDFGEEGLLDTMEVLEEAGIAYIGAGVNIEEAGKIVYVVANGKKIAFVAATEIERTTQYTKEATTTAAGVLKTNNPQRFIKIIKQAALTSDYVIAVPHWGTEGALYADSSQQRQAKLYAEAGADVIIGGHPHRLQGIAYYGDTPIAYSLGNFWFSTGTLYTTVVQVVIQADGALQLRFLPCEQKNLVTSLLTEEADKDEFYHYLAKISTNVVIDEAGNVYNKKELSEDDDREFLYDSATSTTSVTGGRDNEGFAIDIVGNRKK